MVVPKNSFGAIRLTLSSLVIVAHTPEMLDGNRSRELLTHLFGTMSFGELAVMGFFLISGYLITASATGRSSLREFMTKRVLRIYPAFLVCSLLCILVVAPIAGGNLIGTSAWRTAINLLMLQPPEVDRSFTGLQVHQLNGAMWTISYEFRCYFLAALAGVVGLHSRRWVYLGITGVVLAAAMAWKLDTADVLNHAVMDNGIDLIVGGPEVTVRFLGLFMVGGCFRLFRERITWSPIAAVASACVVLLAVASGGPQGYIAIATFGAYALFWLALNVGSTINAKNDISYGVYLYAWPITALLMLFVPGINVMVLGVLTFVGAWFCGQASWRLIEAPAARFKPGIIAQPGSSS